MTTKTLVHLMDDTTAGGVTRVVSHMTGLPDFAGGCRQQVKTVNRRAWSHGRIDADVIISHLAISWRSLPALMALRAQHPGARLIHVEHSYTQQFVALNVPAARRFYSLLRVAYSLFDGVVAVSEGQGKWIAGRELVDPERLFVIPSAINLRPFSGLPQPSRAPRVLGAIGRLDRQKGFDFLIEAFKAAAPADGQLKIYGQGPEEARLRALIGTDSRIELVGHRSDPTQPFAEVDAVVMPSRWEAYGLVALEARAAGRALLVSGADGLADHVAAGAQVVHGFGLGDWSRALKALFQTSAGCQPMTPGEITAMEQSFSANWRAVIAGTDLQQVSPKRRARTSTGIAPNRV